MTEARGAFTATLLPDGRLLVAGGIGAGGVALAGGEIYDPAQDRWSAGGVMSTPRAFHTATWLPGPRKVLVAGGMTSPTGGSLSTAELYDPSTNTWTAVSPMRYARARHAATLLADGTVLVAGGAAGSSSSLATEIYNPVSNAWGGAGAMLVEHAVAPVAVRLASGKVLLFGGTDPNGSPAGGSTVEGYDPATAGWTPQRNYPSVSRDYATATLLADGTVLVVGGEPSQGGGGPIIAVDLYDPSTQSWQLGPAALFGHCGHTATLLNNGDVLVAGGRCGPPATSGPAEGAIAVVEVYHPGKGWMQVGMLASGRGFMTATLLNNGRVLVAGGFDSQGSPLRSAEVLTP